MKYLLLAACIGSLFAESPSYTLKGQIQGFGNGWVYLYHQQREKDPQDSVMAKNGQFQFRGVAESPEFCLLAIKNKSGKKEFRTGFFLEARAMLLTAKKDSMQNAVIKGSPTQDEYIQYQESQKALEMLSGKLDALYNAAEAKKDEHQLDSIKKAYTELSERQQQAIKEYTIAHPASYVAAYEIYANFSYNPDAVILKDIYGRLDTSVQKGFFGKKIKETLDAAELTAIGNPAPDFTLNDVDGRPVSLSSLKGQYVLVDFWASWCGPCRAENPAVVKAYSQFHGKGFTIMGVSLDDKKDKWIEAIK